MMVILTENYPFVKYYKKINLLLICLLLFFLPFIFWPAAEIPYEIPRVWFFQRGIEIISLLILIQFLIFFLKRQKKSEDLSLNSVDFPLIINLLVFLFLIIFSSIFGVDFPKSLVGNYYRGDGLFTLFHLIAFSLIIGLFFKKEWKNFITGSIVVGSFFLSLWVVHLGIRLHFLKDNSVFHWQKAIGGSFGQPNFLGGYLAVASPFSFYLFSSGKKIFWRTAFIFLILIEFLALLLTFSWGGILVFFLSIFLWLFFKAKNFWQKRMIFSLFLIFFLAFSFFYFQNEKKTDFVFEGRRRIFYKVFLGALKRPIFGWGLANVDYAFESVDWPIKVEKDVYVDKAHSHLLEIFTTIGLAGLTVYLLFLINILKKILKKIKKEKENQKNFWQAIFIVFIIFVFHSQTNVISIAEEVLFWLVAGLTIKE